MGNNSPEGPIEPDGSQSTPARRLPIGAEPQSGGGVHFRVWAPAADNVAVDIDGAGSVRLSAEADGYFSGLVDSIGAGERYRFRVDGEKLLPDPASRFQPDGPHDSSEIIDPTRFKWTDTTWLGLPQERLAIYEL